MGKAFFTGWALWQQMTFVLACGIVATFFAGLLKLQYDRYRIRKYSKVEKGKKVQTAEMLESQPISLEPKGEDVPFGIRAIESGIEVDGVWISRTNTPVGSSRSSINEIKLPRSNNGSQLELPKAAYASSSRDSSRAPSSAFDRAVSAERLPTNESGRSSPNYDADRGRALFAPNARYSNPNLTRNSATLQALEGQFENGSSARYQNQPTQAGPSNNSQSSRTSDESDYMTMQDGRPYEAAYINPKHTHLAAPTDPRTDLNLLQSHRLSHVAETGQLTPRVRKPGHSGEWASVAENMRSPQEIASSNGVDYFVPQQKTPSPPLGPVVGVPQELPSTAASPYANNDGHAYNQAKQAVPLLETYAPQAQRTPEAYQPRGPQHGYYEYTEEPENYDQSVPSQRNDQVLRKVNSGFEILRPGTFGEPTSPEEEGSSPTSPNGGEKRQSRRLQKKRRSSGSSRKSHFVEQV